MAPVLAQLDQVDGVRESRVDWTGRRFLLTLAPGARAERVVESADEALDGDTRVLRDPAAREAIASYLRGEQRWMRAGETRELSRTEARILAVRHGEEAAREADFTPAQTAKFIEVLEGEIAAAFERIHAEGRGLPGDFGATYRRVLADALDKSRAFLSAEQLERVRAYAERMLGG